MNTEGDRMLVYYDVHVGVVTPINRAETELHYTVVDGPNRDICTFDEKVDEVCGVILENAIRSMEGTSDSDAIDFICNT